MGRRVYHGLSRHPLYGTWCQMMARCYNPKHRSYARYGARGIYVCERWRDVRQFINDIERLLGPRPPGMSLDRKDNDGPYAEWNIRWASAFQQRHNTHAPDRPPANRSHPLYHVWIRMRQRHPTETCAQWWQFKTFAADVEKSIGLASGQVVFRRIDPDGRYEPGNIRWGISGRPLRRK